MTIELKEIDFNEISRLNLEISRRYKKIMLLFPKGNNVILKHLAASSVHLAFFARDIFEIANNDKMPLDDEMVEKFLAECGCDFNKKEDA